MSVGIPVIVAIVLVGCEAIIVAIALSEDVPQRLGGFDQGPANPADAWENQDSKQQPGGRN